MEPTAEKTWRIPNRLEAMAQAAKEVFEWLADQPVSSRVKYSTGLVVEEMVGNVIKYAYADDAIHHIRFGITIFPDYLQVVFEDDGTPFDPTRYPPPDIDKIVNSSRPGGLGIQLVRKVSSKMTYEREGSLNRVTLRIRRLEPGDTQRISLNPS